MALLTTQVITADGIVPTFAAVAASDTFKARTGTYVEVVNGNAGAVTVTFDSKAPSNYGTDVDLVVTVAAGTTEKIYLGDNQDQRFNDPATGVATVTCSPTASVTIGVFHV